MDIAALHLENEFPWVDVRTSKIHLSLSLSLMLFQVEIDPTITQSRLSLIGVSSRNRPTKTCSWEKLRFLADNSRSFIVTWPFLTQPSPWATLQGRPTVSEPPFRLYGNRFFECARLQFFRTIFIANPFDRSTKRSFARASRWSLPGHPSLGHS